MTLDVRLWQPTNVCDPTRPPIDICICTELHSFRWPTIATSLIAVQLGQQTFTLFSLPKKSLTRSQSDSTDWLYGELMAYVRDDLETVFVSRMRRCDPSVSAISHRRPYCICSTVLVEWNRTMPIRNFKWGRCVCVSEY